ncbi:Membrane protein containing DUF368 [Planctomycetales bacterium 10988]|nr:Membrane protein containing DUF368 [Planctomycetales bacterium 10988]
MEARQKKPFRRDLYHLLSGFLMGVADTVPGVSGGTIALIMGVYERLVTAISHVDTKLFGFLKERSWRKAFDHLDLRFVMALGFGIVLGFGSLASVMKWLLDREEGYPEQTHAVFFGLILGSTILLMRMIDRWNLPRILLALAGAAFAFWLAGLVSATAPEGLIYLFGCGAIAICAMILPGISGSLILKLLGKYYEMIHAIVDTLKGDIHLDNLMKIAAFGSGAVLGLLTFSKLLRWLFANYRMPTLAVLCGIMLGALRSCWPFQVGIELENRTSYVNTWPPGVWASIVAIVLATLAAGLVFLLHIVAPKEDMEEPLEEDDHPTVAEDETEEGKDAAT